MNKVLILTVALNRDFMTIRNIGVYFRDARIGGDGRLRQLLDALSVPGISVHVISGGQLDGIDMLLSVGGDGTFLSSAMLVGGSGIPVLGVNLGRLGFLSENRLEAVAEAVLSGRYSIEKGLCYGLSSRRVQAARPSIRHRLP